MLKVRERLIPHLQFDPIYKPFLQVKFNLFLEIQEHEQALSDAIARLGDLSDGESGMFRQTDPCIFKSSYLLIFCLEFLFLHLY